MRKPEVSPPAFLWALREPPRARRGARILAGLALALALLVAAPALAHEHDPSRSGHPLRMLAYIVHPVGVVLDTLVFRPMHWLISHEPVQTLVGHEADD